MKMVPENPQKSNEDQRLGNTSSFVYYSQQLDTEVVLDKCEGAAVLIMME